MPPSDLGPEDTPDERLGKTDSAVRQLSRHLRILHLEDGALHREFVRRVFADAKIACDITYAANQVEFKRALAAPPYDLILSDYTLPGFGGAEALSHAQSVYPDIPFLFVSGTIGEDRAVDILKDGATDYVLKERLDRLLPSVERALREAEERTKRRVAEESLRQSEERFRLMAENIRDVFWISSADGRQLRYVSPAAIHVYGQDGADLCARPERWFEAITPEDRNLVSGAMAELMAGREYRVEFRIDRPDGVQLWVEGRGYPVRDAIGTVTHAVGVVTNITGRKQLESQLLQAQKMEAIGQLAGGIAHDFNNILTVINGNASQLLDGGTLPPKAARSIQLIYTAGERAASLTRQLLVFSRKQAIHREPLDLNATIEESAKLLGRLISEDIRLELILGPRLPPIKADPAMIEQILMNLAVNSRDAMPEGGQLSVITQLVELDAATAAIHPSRRPGAFVLLSVRDTGSGIPPAILPRLFEPFFTTKAPGVGTGLGLATVFGIVRQHDGWVEVESVVSQGACFQVYFPVTTESVAKASPSGYPVDAKGQETVLFVEDEPMLREFAVAVLENAGYRVLQAASGTQALEVWRWHESRIALLLTDVVMPDGMSGSELARIVQSQKPELRIVFTSGFSLEMVDQDGSWDRKIPFLRKPYLPAALTRIVRETLDAPPQKPQVILP